MYVYCCFIESKPTGFQLAAALWIHMCEAERCGLVACPALPLCQIRARLIELTHFMDARIDRSFLAASTFSRLLSMATGQHCTCMHAPCTHSSGIAVSGMWYPNLCQAPGDDGHANTRTLGVRVLLWFMPNAKSSVVIE